MQELLAKVEGLLRRLFPTRASFADGSYVEYLNREAVLYSEKDGHRMEVVWFFNPNRVRGRLLSRQDINSWDSPHEHEPINDAKRKEIERKLVQYCNKRNIPLEII